MSTAHTARTQVRRLPERGHYDRDTIHSILDSSFLCHVGFVHDGHPVVIPTGYGREGDTLYIHGSAASRMQRALAQSVEVCITVTLLDGLVLARSGFHSSMNYRSVVVFGAATPVLDDEQKNHALAIISDQILRGRWADVRPPSAQELKATSVLSIKLDEASAKVRTGHPKDDDEDYELNVWAGIVPVTLQYGEPIADPKLRDGISVPDYVNKLRP
jgi:nitroimidazol reductase NimA-like FMN-containing flavoprotein (pyridoxamine 5'-phosphate oxidase superfamily)